MKLPQIITDAKRDGWYDWIVEPDGSLHPNTERALLAGCTFDVEAAWQIQDFFVEFLDLPRDPGEYITEYEVMSIRRRFLDFDPEVWAPKKPFAMPMWWHKRVIGQLYGWKQPNGAKRYRKAFVTTAKKSYKTTTLAALPIAELVIGGGLEKEAYVIATSKDQAGYLYKKSYAMTQRSRLAKLLKDSYSTNVLRNAKTNSIFKALPAVAASIEGIQPNLLILDELHAWRGRELYDALIYGDIRRTESLRIVITTAGDDENSVAYEEYEAAKDLLDPDSDRYEQDTFAFVAEAGRDPVTQKEVDWEWDTVDAFVQANPTLWENPQAIENTKRQLETAKLDPGKKRGWVRYMCNRYVDRIDGVWIGKTAWDACGVPTEEFPDHSGEKCWAALDLANVEDLVALARCWWATDAEDTIDLDMLFWMPEEGVREKAIAWRLPQLHDWIQQGWIRTTPGAAIDTNFIRRAISGVYLDDKGESVKKRDEEAVDQKYDLQEFAYDRNLAANLVVQQLGQYDGLPVVEHAQTFPGMSEPAKEFHRRIVVHKLRHDSNPVMRWMAGHCLTRMDANGNIKPDRAASRHKIDGIVSAVMAVGRATLSAPERSVYEDRGVLVI